MSTDSSQKTLNTTGSVVAVLLVLILGGGIASLIKFDIPVSNHDILLVLITAVATNITNIINFFYGSSVGAKSKDDTINTLATSGAASQAALTPNIHPDNTKVTLDPGQSATIKAVDPTP